MFIAKHLHPKNHLSLCALIQPSLTKSDEAFLHHVGELVRGGVKCIQLWDDLQNAIKYVHRVTPLKKLGIPVIINNWTHLAYETGAAGVHLGEGDFPIQEALTLLPNKVVGYTVRNWEDVQRAQALPVSYTGIQVFPSRTTKKKVTSLIGLDWLKAARTFSRHQMWAIGGIVEENLPLVQKELRSGDWIVMAGPLARTQEPYSTAKKFSTLLQGGF